MSQKPLHRTDLFGGLALILIGLWFAAQSWGLEIGTARRMGPGYFPLGLALLLIALGVLIGAKGMIELAQGKTARELGPRTPFNWRGPIFILAAPIFFGITVRGLGFVPALFLGTLLATQASKRMRPVASVILAAAVTAFATGVFLYGLSLPFRPFGRWLPF